MKGLNGMSGSFGERLREERGQTVIEYVLVVVLIALVLVLAFQSNVSVAVGGASKNIAAQISNVAPAP